MKRLLFVFSLALSMGAQAQDQEPSYAYKTCYLVEVAAHSVMQQRQLGVREAVMVEGVRVSDLDPAVKAMTLREIKDAYKVPVMVSGSPREIEVMTAEWANIRFNACLSQLNDQQ